MINKLLISRIKKNAINLDWYKAFDGKAKGNRHLFRVNKIIHYLLRKEGGDKKIAIIGGWIHDVSLAYGSDYDPSFVKQKTFDFLSKFPELSEIEIKKITLCATLHESAGKTSSIESKIVHDADVIDKSGVLGVIRHIWKMTNMLESRVLDKKRDLKILQRHLANRQANLYTSTAIDLVKKLNIKQKDFFDRVDFLDIMKYISTKAMMGWTSDKIARHLITKKVSISHSLSEQLDCKYLL